MRATFAARLRSSSLSAVPPPQTSSEYSPALARVAASILYRTPVPSQTNQPIYVLNAAAFPDNNEVDFDKLLPYVLARLPGEDELIEGRDYEVVFFAGGNPETATSGKKNRPGWGWFVQAYHVLSRAMRKRLQKLYIVHERSWVRILVEMFSTIVSPKFRRKIVHISTLSALALHMPIEDLLIPPSAYLQDRRHSPEIFSPYTSGRRAFSAKEPFPKDSSGRARLPRVLRETTNFLLLEPNVKTEGLFRIPPHSRLRDILKEAYDRGQGYIIWKDNEVLLPVPKHPKAQDQDQIIDEVDQRDSYGVLLAAGLLKSWYADLRQPIFPEFSYKDLKQVFGDVNQDIELEQLAELISPQSEWSKLPVTSRMILVRHLLPLLSSVALQSEYNKMTAENLAVCFAPALLCGPDQLEDAKVSSIIRRILTIAIGLWPVSLQKACQIDSDLFRQDLLLSSDPADWDDPLEMPRRPLQKDSDDEDETLPDEKHFTGIIMQDNAQNESPPPLPPRSSGSGDSNTKRKPAPPALIPPRYSTIVQDGSLDMAHSPATDAAVTDGFSPVPVTSPSLVAEGKPGAKSTGYSPEYAITDHRALTSEQIDQSEPVLDEKQRIRGMPLPGLARAPMNVVIRKPVNSGKVSPGIRLSPSEGSAPSEQLRQSSVDSSTQFRRPSWSASSAARQSSLPTPSTSASTPVSRSPTIITSLARPVYPAVSSNQKSLSPSSMARPSFPKPKAASPSLMQRMPSFEQPGKATIGHANLQSPGRLNLRKASVEDLRRIYEERVPAAQSLVEVGLQRRKTQH